MNYTKNLLVNGIPLGIFIYGAVTGTAWALTTSIVLYWILIVLSIALIPVLPIDNIMQGDKKLGAFSGTTTMISKAFNNFYIYFNIIQDIAIAFIFSYFGYPIMAIFYALHIFGYVIMYWNIKQYILTNFTPDSWEAVAQNLKKALEAGETEFNFFKLAGQEDPQEVRDRLKDIK